MDCRTFNKKLEDYLQGELDFPGRFGMERHAEQCFACGKTAADAQKLGRMARNLGRVRAPADFEAALLARIQKEGLARRSSWFWRFPLFWSDRWPWRAAAFGALAVVVLGVGVFIFARRINVEPDGSVRWTGREEAPAQPLQSNAEINSSTVPLEPSDLAEVSERIKPLPGGMILSPRESGLSLYAEPAGAANYVQYVIPGPDDRQMLMRLPKTIWMRHGQPSEEYYIRNVSH